MFFLAIRHLESRKRQTFLTLMGIMLGTAAYVSISGMMLGFQSFIVDQLVNNDSHVRVTAREEYLTERSLDSSFYPGPNPPLISWIKAPSGRRDNAFITYPSSWYNLFEKNSMVEAYSPQIVAQVLASRGNISQAARLVGSQPHRQTLVTNIEKYMLQGRFKDISSGGNRIIIGGKLAEKLGVTVGETLLLSVGKNIPRPFKIVGTFLLGVKSVDETTIFGSLSDVQMINGTPGRISDIAVRLRDVSKAESIATHWSLLGAEKIQSWDQANEGIMSVFKTQDIVRNFMTISILIVAAFGIYNILNMAVNNKRREISILRSMGYLPLDIIFLFLIQGLILGMIGGLCGDALGYIACRLMELIPISANRGLGAGKMLVVFFPGIYIRGFFLAFLSSALASYFPARSAGKLDPIDIIRSGNT
jgi:lipoprotein-releasing system permease protein